MTRYGNFLVAKKEIRLFQHALQVNYVQGMFLTSSLKIDIKFLLFLLHAFYYCNSDISS